MATGDNLTDQVHHFKGLSIDEDAANEWSSKYFAYSRSQSLTCVPVTSGSFVRLVYGLYSKVYSRSFIELQASAATGNELAALLGKIGARGLHTLAPCPVPTSVYDLVPSYGVLALNSVFTGGGRESTIDNLVRDLKQANSLLPVEQQCALKCATITVYVMRRSTLNPVRIKSRRDIDDADEEYEDNDDYISDSSVGDCHHCGRCRQPSPSDVLFECDQLYSSSCGLLGLAIGRSISIIH